MGSIHLPARYRCLVPVSYTHLGLGVLGGHDDAAGVAVDAVAQGRSKGVLVPGIPLLLLVEVGLNVGDEGDVYKRQMRPSGVRNKSTRAKPEHSSAR